MKDRDIGPKTISPPRRRRVTLGETLAVIAALISGLTLYLNWSDKRDARADKAAESRRASDRAARLVLDARVDGGKRLLLAPTQAGQIVQSQIIRFPAALKLSPVATTGEPRIEARWFADALKRARDKAKLPDDSLGDESLPVEITTRFVADGETRVDTALYDIGYSIAGKWLTGHELTLRGLSLVSRGPVQHPQVRLDARWATTVKGRS
ncbi:hypothetical protein J3E64_000675 [Sphingobium sp. OAS761]|uniref:hypothetical protein n=1 Tax=Sphingobium sp. OAS761 TaxID=2817901 RepID=UPI00209E6F7D|nr:hypothetical protein [Sphingobium sp. OAS761]MCP1469004.1 hypothetical protein [Sphingobium sp. OAS761]